MFYRIEFAQWVRIFPTIGFVLLFSVFLSVAVRVIRMSRGYLDHLSSLPLDADGNAVPQSNQNPSHDEPARN